MRTAHRSDWRDIAGLGGREEYLREGLRRIGIELRAAAGG